jgi:hypothetical protein
MAKRQYVLSDRFFISVNVFDNGHQTTSRINGTKIFHHESLRINESGDVFYNFTPKQIYQLYKKHCDCPSGNLIGWKFAGIGGRIKMKILIPNSAQRLNVMFTNECRADKIQIISMWDQKFRKITECTSWFDKKIKYKCGNSYYCNDFNNNPLNQYYAKGFHFYLTLRDLLEA